MIIERIPHLSDNEIARLFANALDQKEGPRNAQAIAVIEAIQAEWQRRHTEIVRGERKGELPETGVLGTLGYHVGLNGVPVGSRRKILDFVMTGQLPFVLSAAHMAEWGEPGSRIRHEKLHRTLSTLRQKLKKDGSTDKAENEYTLDLDYLASRYKDL